jgi:nucleotide-binding universal stress UspA family protein
MYQKMLVLLDGSELAEVVFKYAQEISGRMKIQAELLHVCSPREAEQLPMRKAYMEHMAEQLCQKALETTRKYDPDAMEHCVHASGHVVVGYPAEEILEYIDANEIDLVMMSTHGSSGEKSWDLGSVANKVVHASKVPVWLVPTELREEVVEDTLPGGRSLVVPLSGSPLAEAAIPHAIDMITQRGAEAEIVLVNVIPFPEPTATLTRASLEEHEAEIERMKTYLETTAQVIRAQGVPVRTEVLRGEPAETIIQYLREHPAQLLAMATRGHRTLSRMIFGSVAESVVLLVKKTPLLLISADAS